VTCTSLAASATSNFSLKKVTLRTADKDRLTRWYTDYLEFVVEADHGSMITLRKGSFTLSLEEHRDAIALSQVQLEEGKNRVTGIYKFGFAINDLDSLYEYVLTNELETHGGLIEDAQAGMRSFILIDPDHNYIQFFEKKGALISLKEQPDWHPAFLMSYTNDFRATYDWYAKLGFKEVSNYDNSGRQIFQRAIFNGELLIELVEFQARVAVKAVHPQISERLVGVVSIGCASSISDDSIIDAAGNHIEITHEY
jgi:catechol 2,3-dioxygenase-like lactoylglutathione lyase family enzyme